MYADMSFGVDRFKTYAERIMKVTRENFLKWRNRFPETVTERNVVQHSVWIDPSPFLIEQYAKDETYIPRNEAPDGEQLQKE